MTRIYVGVDGSIQAEKALLWAVDEGNRMGAGVTAVLGWQWLDHGAALAAAAGGPLHDERAARRALSVFVERAIGAGAAAGVRQDVMRDLPAHALVSRARADDLVVVGARGLGWVRGHVVGSVSRTVLRLAPCPVVVVPDRRPGQSAGRIVVAVDGSSGSTAAVRWALAEARRRGTILEALHAWTPTTFGELPSLVIAEEARALEVAARQVLARVWDDQDVRGLPAPPQARLVTGGADAVATVAADAALLVVGTRGRSQVVRAVLGSFSRHLARHSRCPLVVVPDHPAVTVKAPAPGPALGLAHGA